MSIAEQLRTFWNNDMEMDEDIFNHFIQQVEALEAENIRLEFELDSSNDALRIARLTLQELGFPDLPFLDDGIRHAIAKQQAALKVARDGLIHARSWRPFGEAISNHFDDRKCPIEVAITEIDEALNDRK